MTAPALLGTRTPHALFHTQAAQLEASLAGVFDANPEAIHDARVATRRLRQVLPLLDRHLVRLSREGAERTLRRMGRSLGKVRDTDVRIALLTAMERRIPLAAPSLVVARQRHERKRLRRMRRLIKRFERLDAARFVRSLLADPNSRMSVFRDVIDTRVWRRDLLNLIGERARNAEDAIRDAAGVYFPRRVHRVRIALKKLRYSMEILHETGVADGDAALAALKKGQDLLGDLHDLQALIDDFCAASAEADPDVDAHATVVRHVLEHEIAELHHRYLARREELAGICRAAQAPFPTGRLSARPVLAVGAIALTSGLMVRRYFPTHGR